MADGKGHQNDVELPIRPSGSGHFIAQANAQVAGPKLHRTARLCPSQRRIVLSRPEAVTLMDVSPTQIVSVAASLVPFLEHDDRTAH